MTLSHAAEHHCSQCGNRLSTGLGHDTMEGTLCTGCYDVWRDHHAPQVECRDCSWSEKADTEFEAETRGECHLTLKPECTGYRVTA